MNDAKPNPAAGRENLAIELTGFEMLTLLSLADGDGAEGTRKVLHLPDLPQDSPLLSAGVSSLIVRKLAVPEPDEQRITPQGKVVAFTAIMSHATEWVEASGGAEKSLHAAVLMKGPAGAALLEPKPFGIWLALPLPAERPLTELAADYVKAAFGDVAQRPFAGAVRVLEAGGGTSRASVVRVDAQNRWEFSSGVPDAMPDPVVVDADPTFRLMAKGVAA